MWTVAGLDPGPHGAPVTMTSRLRRAPGARHPWSPEPGIVVDLPVVLDFVITHRDTGEPYGVTEAMVDLRGGEPALVSLTVTCPDGVDVVWTQRRFRWSGPLEVVTRTVPDVIRAGRDPFDVDYPVADLPAATRRAAAPAVRRVPGGHRPRVPHPWARVRARDGHDAPGLAAHGGLLGGEGPRARDPGRHRPRPPRRRDPTSRPPPDLIPGGQRRVPST